MSVSSARTIDNQLKWQHILLALLIVGLAFSVRSVVLVQRAAYDPSFLPVDGRDDHTYWEFVQGFVTGAWPPSEPHYFHPGPVYILGSSAALSGGADIITLSLIVVLFDTLTVGALIGAGWLLTRSIWGGLLSGAIYALYPVAVFYSTTLLIAPLAAGLIAWWLFLTLWQRERLTLWRTIGAGVLMGLLALSRLNLAPLLALYGLWLLSLRGKSRHFLLHASIYLVTIILTIAPTTWHNFQTSNGAFIPVASTGPLELYMANNRDSAGLHTRTPALDALDTDYTTALLRDIQIAPEHSLGLLGYKLALFVSALEPGNNLTVQASTDVTPLLQLLPGNFQWLLVFGLLGLGALWAQDRQAAGLLAVVSAWMLMSFLLVFAFGRLRYPVVVPLTLLSAYFFVSLREGLAGKKSWSSRLRPYVLPAVLCSGLLVFSAWVLVDPRRLPPERTYTELPSNAQLLDVDFGDVRLRAWRPLQQWPAASLGWVEASEAYTVELFWQVTQTTPIAYQFYMGYFDGGIRYTALDRLLGGVSFPTTTTDLWQSDRIYGEIVSLRFDQDEPAFRSGQIRVGVWYWDDEGLIVNVPAATDSNNVALQTLAMLDPLNMPLLPDGVQPIAAQFGDLIQLTGYDYPQQGVADEVVDIVLSWRALANIDRDYTMLVHLDDAQGRLVAQGDALPVPNLYTSNWPPGVDLPGRTTLRLPQTPGTYTLYVGLYDAAGRLPTGTADQRIRLGNLTINSL